MLLFRDREPGAAPLAIQAGGRVAIPLFGSTVKARSFLGSADFGDGWEPVELSVNGLIRVLESCRDQAGYVALDPPPATESGMRVEVGSLKELLEALRQSQEENDLFGLGQDGLS